MQPSCTEPNPRETKEEGKEKTKEEGKEKTKERGKNQIDHFLFDSSLFVLHSSLNLLRPNLQRNRRIQVLQRHREHGAPSL